MRTHDDLPRKHVTLRMEPELADALGKPSSEAARKAARRALVALVQRMEREEK